MAYMSQAQKKKIAGILKEKLKGYDIKYSLSVRNHSTIVCTIRSGSIDFGQDQPGFCYQVNQYSIKNNYSGIALEVLNLINEALHTDHFDKSDAMTDYFHCSHYVSIQIGEWNKKYQYQSKAA